ncbi:nitrogen regulation sensor histidine kinase NtrY, HAMP and PAS domain-containing [Candidatus Moduliflexus flocculans]|uniref:histidine kinase n=1 Tax=Candidatus Moduliflexus flocculans TaxID=1499966 RepID=A0A081BQ74_9BACT|nr:nitrogen regulation sensor histidine kinase NtrY, HAMP and PAS domain-containing [Candidatus Moduliflexus flocculans]
MTTMNAPQERIEQKKRLRRRMLWVALIALASVTALGLLLQQLKSPTPLANNLLIFALVNLNIILLVALMLVVARNLAKFYFERKQNILGAKFQTRLILSFIFISIIPTILLFVVASNLLTQSIGRWFNEQIERSLQESLEVAQAFYRNSINNSVYFAEQLSEILTDKRMLREQELLTTFLKNKQQEFRLGEIVVYTLEGEELTRLVNPNIPIGKFNLTPDEILEVGKTGKQRSVTASLPEGDLIKSLVPIHSKWEANQIIGVLLVDYFVEASLAVKMKSIRNAFESYKQIKIHKTPILGSYLLTFLLATLLVLFSAIWFGMHLARGMTVPIQQLALGTRIIAEGNLDYKVDVVANDEIGILVDSFNQMTTNLKTMTDEVTERRRYIETVLENIATGVVSIAPDGTITTFNRAACRILEIQQADVSGQHYRVLFERPDMKRVITILRQISEQYHESYEDHFDVKINNKTLSLFVNINRMYDEQERYLGMLIVFDDLTQLLHAQRIAAWREVARRLAHEIKNPLTPLQLSAERLRKQAQKKSPRYEEIFEECTQTIIAEVDGLRHLVDEFSKFARMPAIVKAPTALHDLLKQTISPYAQHHKHIRFSARFSKDIAMISADTRQLKQVFVNLIENAIQAMNEEGELFVQTLYDARRSVVIIKIADTGPGISDDRKERLFIPYFSTKGSGRGLGLAIVHNIIREHGGAIRIENNEPKGAVFVIELPTPRGISTTAS